MNSDVVAVENGGLVVTGAAPVKLVLRTPWNVLERQRSRAVLPATSTSRVSACSDGLDNDHDGLSDIVDPGCDGDFAKDTEGSEPSRASNLALTLDTADNKVFIKSLSWKGKPVINDDPSYRFYLHSDAGTMPSAPPVRFQTRQ